MVSKEKCFFTVDDLPTPVLVYSKKNGKILSWNKSARKLFGFTAKDLASVHQLRGEFRSYSSARKTDGGCIDLGVIPHITKKGNERLLKVLEKSASCQGEPCFVNWITDVTEYVQTEMAYANFYGAVTSASIVSMADKKGIITYVNREFEKISGYSRKELIGQNHRIINSGHHQKKFWVDMWKTIATGKTWRAEVKNRAKDGSYYWVDTFVMPFLDKNGRVEKYLSIRNDITDRKSHEEEITGLVRQLSEFNFAINNASIVSRADKKGTITYINDNFIRISGYKSEELIGQNHRIINSGFHSKSFWVNMWKTIASGKTWRAEVKNKAKNGSYYWVDTFIMPFLDEQGKIKEFLSIRNDITKRKSQEEEITSLNNSLADFQNAITSSSIVSRADKRGVITYVNENFVKISGYSAYELIGQNHRIINSGYHSKEFWANMWRTIASGKTWRADVKNEAKDGSYYWVDTFIMPFLDEQGKVCEFLSIRNDITTRKKIEEELIQTNESLSETLVFGKMGSALLDLNTFQLTVSPELLKLLEEKDTATQTLPLQDFFTKYIKPEYLELVQKRVKEGIGDGSIKRNTVNAEFEMISAQGRSIWIEAKGIFAGSTALGILHDVTERKEKEQRILKEHEHLNAIINSLPGIFYLFDENGKFLKWNKNFETISEYSSDEIAVMSPLDFFREDEKALIAQKIGAALTEGTADVEANFLTKSNRTIPYYFNGFAATFEGKRCLIGMGLDLSDVKKIEGESLGRLKMIEMMLNGITDGFFATDRDLNFTMINPAFATLAELAPEEMLGKNILDLYPAFKSSELYGSYQDAIVKQKPLTLELKAEASKVFAVNVYPNSGGLFVYYKDITSSKKAEEKLLETRDLFSKLSANVPGMSYNFYLNEACEGVFPFVSEGSFPLFGIKADEIKNNAQVLLKRIHKEDVQAVFDSIRIAFNEVSPWNAEFRVLMDNGSIKWIAGASNPYQEKSGNYYWYGFMYDITERKQSELAIQLTNERFRTLYNQTPAMMHSMNSEGCLARVSDYWLQKMEYAREEVIGKKTVDFLTNESRKKAVEEILPHFFKNGSVTNAEVDFVTKSGKVLNTLLSSHGEFDIYGKFDKSLAVITDITEKKKLEREIEKLALIAKHTSNAVILCDREGRITWVNEGFIRITEYTLEEVLGKKPGELLQGPETNQATIKFMSQCIASGEGFKEEVLNYSKSGKKYWLDIEVMPIRDDDNELKGFMAIETDITQLKLAVSEMLNSQSRLQIMMNNAPMVVYMKDLRNRYTFTNDAFITALGVSKIKSGHTDFDLFPREIAEEHHRKDLEVAATAKPVSYEHSVNGKQYYTVKFPISDLDGRTYSIGGMSIDITENKKAERITRESELRLRTILETEPECVKILNEEGRLLEMNKAGLEMIEASDFEQVRCCEVISLVHEPYRKDFMQLTKDVFEGKTGMLEFKMTGIKGTTRWLETHAVPLRDAEGKITSLLGVTRDVTQRKEVERKLIESEERYRKLFELNPAPTWIYDINTLKFLNVNKAAVDHYGYSHNEFKEMTIFDIRPEEEKGKLQVAIEELKREDYDDAGNFPKSWKHVKKDGTIIDVELMTTALDFSDRTPRLVTVNDVTEKLKVQHKLMSLVNEKEMLIREIHHRVKNNLQLISSILYIRMSKMQNDGMKDFLNEMRQRIKSIAFLHERLLQSGSINHLEMTDYLHKLISDIKMSMDSKASILVINTDIESLWMDLDSAIYCGLIMNELITNSIKHAFQDRGTGTITVSLKRVDQKNEFVVADDGVGIELPVAVNNVNSNFGMQLVDTFAKQLKAEVTIDNAVGTKFKFVF